MKNIENEQLSRDTRHSWGTPNDHAQMSQMIWGFTVSQIVHAAALYSLPEHLGLGWATAAEIAAAESLNVDAVFRWMRACASIGLLTYDGHSRSGGVQSSVHFSRLWFFPRHTTSTPFVLMEAVAA
jgi:hypothetical protein